jgi:hypothetical protein
MHEGKSKGLALLIGMTPKPSREAPPKMGEEPPSKKPSGRESSNSGITPEMVSFRTSEQVCGNCTHMTEDQCDLLNISVASGDSCHAYSERESHDREEPAEPTDDAMPEMVS